MSFARRLKAAREAKHMTQSELARAIGVSRSTICNYENGNRERLSMPVLTALGKALDVSLGTLLPPDEFKERSLTVKFSNIPRKYIDELPDTSDCDPDDFNLSLDSDFDRVKRFYLLLNDLGKQEAVKRMEELTLLPQYKNVKSGPKT